MPRYYYDCPVEFKLKEKVFSLSGDDFSIKRLDTNQNLFKVKGNWMSFRDSKKMYDDKGNAIFKMTEALISLRDRMHIEDCDTGEKCFTLRKKGIIPFIGTSTIKIWRGDKDDGEPALEIKGSILRKNFNITDTETGKVICSVKRKALNIRNIVFDSDTYVVRVEPGVNAALMVFLVIAIDENYRDD